MLNQPLLLSACAVLIYVSIAWLISAILSRADIVDPFWGPGFFVIATTIVLFRSSTYPTENLPTPGLMQLRNVLLLATGIWGLRLGLHLLIRWLGEKHEDRRYSAMRSQGNERWWLRSLFTVFWLQGLIMWIVSLPIQFALLDNTTRSALWLLIGVILFLTGLCFETIGDWQLTRFRRSTDNAGRVLNTGLWRYTRHPNYFGDFAVWWGLFAISIHFGAPGWTLISPLIMSWLLMKFSGVGMLEKDIKSRRPGYEEYVRQTSTFWPWFPNLWHANHENQQEPVP